MTPRVMFLDRDGVINVDRGYVHRREDFELIPGTVQALRSFQRLGFHLAIVTNQSGVGIGRYPEQDVIDLHQWMERQFALEGVTLTSVAYCPHAPLDHCDCRKPAVGLARRIVAQVGPIDISNSWIVGDKVSDVEFGVRLGAQTALVPSRYWSVESLSVIPTVVTRSLRSLSETITALHLLK